MYNVHRKLGLIRTLECSCHNVFVSFQILSFLCLKSPPLFLTSYFILLSKPFLFMKDKSE